MAGEPRTARYASERLRALLTNAQMPDNSTFKDLTLGELRAAFGEAVEQAARKGIVLAHEAIEAREAAAPASSAARRCSDERV